MIVYTRNMYVHRKGVQMWHQIGIRFTHSFYVMTCNIQTCMLYWQSSRHISGLVTLSFSNTRLLKIENTQQTKIACIPKLYVTSTFIFKMYRTNHIHILRRNDTVYYYRINATNAWKIHRGFGPDSVYNMCKP